MPEPEIEKAERRSPAGQQSWEDLRALYARLKQRTESRKLTPLRAVLRGLHMLGNALAISFSFMAVYLIDRTGALDFVRPFRGQGALLPYSLICAALGTATVCIALLAGAYRRYDSIMNVGHKTTLLRSLTCVIVVMLGVDLFLRLEGSRLFYVLGFCTAVPALLWSSNLMLRVLNFFHGRGIGVDRVAILGNNYLGRMIARKLFQQQGSGLVPVGIIGNGEPGAGQKESLIPGHGESLSLLGTSAEAKSLVQQHDIDELIIAPEELSSGLLADYLKWQSELDVTIHIVPPVSVLALQFSDAEQLDGIPLIRFNSLRRCGLYPPLKRLMDVLVSALLIVLTLPAMAGAALLVWLTSGRPIFFTQKRVGEGGEPFTIYKLRSMRPDTPEDARSSWDAKNRNITAFGRILRYFDIDELPQLFNVLVGNMSLVGPRPEMPWIVDEYDEVHRLRLLMKPGMTGLWQLSEHRNSPIHEAVDYDICYMERQSLTLDIVILLDTVWYLLAKVVPF